MNLREAAQSIGEFTNQMAHKAGIEPVRLGGDFRENLALVEDTLRPWGSQILTDRRVALYWALRIEDPQRSSTWGPSDFGRVTKDHFGFRRWGSSLCMSDDDRQTLATPESSIAAYDCKRGYLERVSTGLYQVTDLANLRLNVMAAVGLIISEVDGLEGVCSKIDAGNDPQVFLDNVVSYFVGLNKQSRSSSPKAWKSACKKALEKIFQSLPRFLRPHKLIHRGSLSTLWKLIALLALTDGKPVNYQEAFRVFEDHDPSNSKKFSMVEEYPDLFVFQSEDIERGVGYKIGDKAVVGLQPAVREQAELFLTVANIGNQARERIVAAAA